MKIRLNEWGRCLLVVELAMLTIAAQAESDTYRIAAVPLEKHEVFRVPVTGAILTLKLTPSGEKQILSSTITYEDTSDTSALWKPVSTPPCGDHVYETMGTKYAGREWVSVHGTLGFCGGVGQVAAATIEEFDVDVPAVDIVLNNKSSTVADGQAGAIHEMTDTEEDNDGAEMRINADFDEAPTGQIEDYLRAGITAADPDLLVGRLRLNGHSVAGKWRLTIAQPNPAAAKVYYQDDAGDWTEVTSGTWSAVVTTPKEIPLRVEGVGGSAATKDVTITADFQPSDRPDACTDHAFVTVVKSEFMLTFDDGPYREQGQTGKVLDVLLNTFVNGQHVRAALFEVGSWGWPPGAAEGIDGPDGGPTNYDLTARVHTDGHHVGNHHMTHTPIGLTQSGILACEQLIRTAVQTVEPNFEPERIFRPPYLFDVGQNVLPPGYKIIWGFLTGDASPSPQPWTDTATTAIERLKTWRTKDQPRRKKHPLVLIMHDWPEPTYNHLQDIIAEIRAKGFLPIDFDVDSCVGTNSLTRPTYYDDDIPDP